MKNYTNLSGRARRKEFCVMVQIGLTVLAMILDKIVFGPEPEFFNECVALGYPYRVSTLAFPYERQLVHRRYSNLLPSTGVHPS